MFLLCEGLGFSKSLHGQLCLSAQCHAPFPNFQWTPQALLGGLSGWRGPRERPLAPDPWLLPWLRFCPPPLPVPDEFPPLPPLPPLFPPLPPPRPLTAATAVAPASLASMVATTVELAALDAQTASALSKTASKVAASKSMSAMAFLTTEGRDRLHIPSTMSAQ